jgi:hypothetical protein
MSVNFYSKLARAIETAPMRAALGLDDVTKLARSAR